LGEGWDALATSESESRGKKGTSVKGDSKGKKTGMGESIWKSKERAASSEVRRKEINTSEIIKREI